MPDVESLYNDILNAPADSALAKEAKSQTGFGTVPTGSYRFDPKGVKVEPASDKSPWPGRLMVKVRVKASSPSATGSVLFDASPIVNRTDSGRLDGPSVLWGNYIASFGMENASNREVADAIGTYPVMGYVDESFNTPEGWVTAKTEADRKRLDTLGYPARNFVRNVKAIKD